MKQEVEAKPLKDHIPLFILFLKDRKDRRKREREVMVVIRGQVVCTLGDFLMGYYIFPNTEFRYRIQEFSVKTCTPLTP